MKHEDKETVRRLLETALDNLDGSETSGSFEGFPVGNSQAILVLINPPISNDQDGTAAALRNVATQARTGTDASRISHPGHERFTLVEASLSTSQSAAPKPCF